MSQFSLFSDPGVDPADRANPDDHPTCSTLALNLVIRDAEVIDELRQHASAEAQQQFALSALRIGVLALRQARGQVDGELLRREGDRLLVGLQDRFTSYSQRMHDQMTHVLKEYFDPQSGRFQERLQRLIQKDGELEQVLRQQVGAENSELCKTLTVHFGGESPLMKMLSPEQSKGILGSLNLALAEQLTAQRDHVVGQFSLDNDDSALSRLVKELTSRQGELAEALSEKIDDVVNEFSLDQEDSALSRLVRNVERAQRTITSEFSLDDEQSALARLKRELLQLMNEQREADQKFREEVTSTLKAMAARRAESKKSTRHGIEFEDAVYEFIQYEANRCGDVPTHTGNTTGNVKNCKVGDCTIDLGPESAAAGERIVVEAKQKAGYQIGKAREELRIARQNRAAQIGVFVFSAAAAPEGIEPLARYGSDIIVVWDPEATDSDIYFKAALALRRAMCLKGQVRGQSSDVDLAALDGAILEIERRSTGLAEIEQSTQAIQSHCEKIQKRSAVSRAAIERQVAVLRDVESSVKQLLSESTSES